MTRETKWQTPTRRWLAAAIIAATAMFAWLGWHAIDAVTTLEDLRESHARAARVHDSILRLEAEVQRTAQLALATGAHEWLDRHAEAESRLRATIMELLDSGAPHPDALHDALAALDAVSRIETRAVALLSAGRPADGFTLVTGPEYGASMAALGAALRRFDDGYHGWLLSHSLGLTRAELTSLAGALFLFAVAIAAWLLLVRQLHREKGALLQEAKARGMAEAGLRRAQKMELLGQLASGVAHDVDNTLSAVAGYSSLARRATDGAQRDQALAGLDRAVKQGRGLTRNLLSFVRHEQAVRRPVELGALVREVQAWLAPLLPGNIVLEVRGDVSRELWLEADPVSLRQAFVNLALNARDAMPEGGMLQVTFCEREATALDNVEPPACIACIGIADTGCGMDAATLRQAREPLFSTKPDGLGTGLGLPSVERVVAAHGGRLELQSEPGSGTRVRMLLPAAAETAAPAAARVAACVVSPDTHAGGLLADALENAGLDVAVCQAVADSHSAASPPAVIVLDWRGQPVDAVAALRALRASGVAAPVILLLEAIETSLDAALEETLAGLAMVVSRSVPLGELGRLVRRLADVGSAARAA